MLIKKSILLSVFISANIFVSAQSINGNWTTDLNGDLSEFVHCDGKSQEECSQYIGKSLQTVYKLNDFYSSSSDRYMLVPEIASFLKSSNRWTKLGPAYQQDVLKDAQQRANSKKAVVAVYMAPDGTGHVALILPGELHPSGSWGLSVPNSASFLTIDPVHSYVGKGLSYAFAKQHLKDVVLFSRSY